MSLENEIKKLTEAINRNTDTMTQTVISNTSAPVNMETLAPAIPEVPAAPATLAPAAAPAAPAASTVTTAAAAPATPEVPAAPATSEVPTAAAPAAPAAPATTAAPAATVTTAAPTPSATPAQTGITSEALQDLMREKSTSLVDNGAACFKIMGEIGVTGITQMTDAQRTEASEKIKAL